MKEALNIFATTIYYAFQFIKQVLVEIYKIYIVTNWQIIIPIVIITIALIIVVKSVKKKFDR